MEAIIFSALLFSIAIQLFYLLGIFSKLAFYTKKEIEHPPQPVSVVVCAHNELANLQHLLPLLFAQDHPEFEIILVDDRSIDGASQWLATLKQASLKVVSISQTPKEWNAKKYALHCGIAAAKNEIILLTDADCEPASKLWISLMTSCIKHPIEACIGYSPYLRENSLLNKIIRYETLYTATQYLSLALSGFPYMGVGRNIAYTKNLFERHEGLNRFKDVLGGDDDLFANQSFTSTNVQIQIAPESYVNSIPKKSYKEWLVQKTRHLHAGKHYKWFTTMVLGLWMGATAIFYATILPLLCSKTYMQISLIVILFRTCVLIYIFVRLNSKLRENLKWYWIPVLDALYIINYMIIGLNTYFFNRQKWK